MFKKNNLDSFFPPHFFVPLVEKKVSPCHFDDTP